MRTLLSTLLLGLSLGILSIALVAWLRSLGSAGAVGVGLVAVVGLTFSTLSRGDQS